MKGDFSRITFDPAKHYSRVLLQQGRVTLDADPNEGAAILLHYIRALARDLIGPYGGPAGGGFGLNVDATQSPARLLIGAGHYYVDGILCESDGCDYARQPDYTPAPPDDDGAGGDALLAQLADPDERTFWVYLDVWERFISWIEDDHIREPALNGPDTCGRTKVVWQVKAVAVEDVSAALQEKLAAIQEKIENTEDPDERAALQAQADVLSQDLAALDALPEQSHATCAVPLDILRPVGSSPMAARLDSGPAFEDPCTIAPDSAYRGAENQLYRVEIHQGTAPGRQPTFKWSRDNGSVATRWLGTDGNDLVVLSTRGFDAGAWVELSDDATDLAGGHGVLVKVVNVQGDRLTIDPASVPANASIAWSEQSSNPRIRRWDQTANDDVVLVDGAVPIDVDATEPNWVTLEDGIQVQFAAGGEYRTGDYWLIPARVATGGIDWPANADGSLFKAPHGIEHHYAPLGFLSWTRGGDNEEGSFSVGSCRCELNPINACAAAARAAFDSRADLVTRTPAATPARPAPSRTTTRRTRTTRPR